MHHSTDDATWIDVDRDPIIAVSSLAHCDVPTGGASEGRRAESPVDSPSDEVVVLAYGAVPLPIFHLDCRILRGETNVAEEVAANNRNRL